MESEKEHDYGHATIGYGTPEEQKVAIIEFIKADFKDNRLISCIKLENESIIIAVENPASSGRDPLQSMMLSKESAIGIMSTLTLYFNSTEKDLIKTMEESAGRNDINYSCSHNIKPNLDV